MYIVLEFCQFYFLDAICLRKDHTFCWFTGVIPYFRHESFSSVLPTFQVDYHASKPIERVVYCVYIIALNFL